MTMVVGYVPTPEGGAAFDRAVSEARRAGEPLVVVNSALHPTDAEGPISTEIVQDALDERLKTAGIEHSIRQLAVGEDPAEVILETAKKVGASAIIIGIRRRSPIGKLILGSSAQRILLDADCPVIAVKP
jgi:nucleotide-binding universal stress UspA family protein